MRVLTINLQMKNEQTRGEKKELVDKPLIIHSHCNIEKYSF